MIVIDKSALIEKYLKRLGRSVTLVKDGNETELFAVIEQTWKRNKARFERSASEIGRHYNGYYFYYGPAKYNISRMSESDSVIIDGETYFFVQTEEVKAGDTVQYYRGVLKKDMGENGYEAV